jgi:hypothetical protein
MNIVDALGGVVAFNWYAGIFLGCVLINTIVSIFKLK